MIVLLLKTSIVIAVVLVFYKIVIEKESFFATNRLYLIIGLVLTFSLPFISLPKLIENQGVVSSLLEPKVQEPITKSIQTETKNSNIPTQNTTEIEAVTDDAQYHKSSKNTTAITTQRSLADWLFIIYIFGIIILSINLISQILNLLIKVYKSKDRIKDDDIIIINSSSVKEPCSFFNYIFINPEQYEFEIYEQIIAHEKIHVKKRHSVDLLLSEIAVILLWFNPFVWLFRKEVEKNIEYQTDSLLIGSHHTEKDSYQMNLLKIATYNKPLTITTNYNQSLIKQRILKMNTKKSNPHSYWKYAFTMPLFFAVLLVLNKPQASFGQEPTNGLNDTTVNEDNANPEYFSDCEAFKNALEEKDVEKLKEILLNLDPACVDYIQNTEQTETTLADVKTKLEEGAALQIDTTGNLVLSHTDGSLDDSTNTIVSSQDVGGSNSECKKLLVAIRADDIEKVRSLLKSTDANCIDLNPGYHIDQSNGNHWRYRKAKAPLFAVARTGNLEIAKLLVENGADVTLVLQGDGTALIEASAFGHLDLVKYFVAKGADVNRKFPNQGNALIAASGHGHLDIMKYLVSKDVDINYYSPNQGNALIAASNSENTDAVKYLVDKGMDINFIAPNQGNALIAAANNGRLETIKYLLSKGAQINKITSNQGTPLIAACNNGHIDTVKHLISNGAEINKIAPNQGTPLIAAANNGHDDVIEYLLKKGAEINRISSNQGTALIAAANNGHLDTIKLLVLKGAEVNLNTSNQSNALNAASNNGHTAVMKYLVSQGADIDMNTNSHGSPLISASKNGQMDVVQYLLDKGADINTQNDGQGSALNAAARNGNNEVIKLLLEKGADINAQTDGQGSALNAAARNGHLDTIELLLEKGADIDLQNNGQGSALNAAARNGLLDTVKLLIEKGADINLYSDGQGTALAAASRNGHDNIVKYLESKGAKHIYRN
ncbi:ankyrin repeat domain-containing protein [Winogradskyella flava]|uniref:Ankyrin repeat domain-containing protein n=1 Tax=Winogradskyella flava TaxID=1884876 RepID=A0A842IUM1_9FLAO|nr:ankyrin repeat domain-containing protein [Winogradskyella flava]MBC2845057.1 ankyrin repeat domain-containing protein [Winogradskyella flava]